MAKAGDRAVDRVQGAGPRAHSRVRPQPCERCVGQILNPRAAIDQQRLADNRTQALIAPRRAVAPTLKLGEDCLKGALDRVATEDPAYERDTVECTKPMEGVESA
jgi:hypothetical protein